MATVGVLLHIMLMACAAKLLLPLLDRLGGGQLSIAEYSDSVATWPVCFLIGTATASTDPGAVLAVLEKLGAPQRLTMLIGGGSPCMYCSDAYVVIILIEIMMLIAAVNQVSRFLTMELRLSSS